jgi:hypothetical protein
MNTLEHKIDEKSMQTLEKCKKNSRVVAAKIFDNMVRIASKKRFALSIKDNRIKEIRVSLFDVVANSEGKLFGQQVKCVEKKEWFTPYIFKNQLYLKNDNGIMPGALIFGKSVNRV